MLLWLLAAMLVALAASFGELSLSHALTTAQRALHEGDASSAVAILERRSDRGRESPEWNFLLARALRRADRMADAEQQLARAKEMGWKAEDVRREELLIKARQGEIKKVEFSLLGLLNAGASDEVAEEIYEAMSQGYWRAYYIGDALKCLEFWCAWQPDNLRPRMWIADLYERTKRPEEAIPEYRKILELDPKNAETLAKIGQILLGKLEIAEAVETFVRSLAASRETPDALLGLADCRRREGSNDEAKELLFEALTFDLSGRQASRATGMLGTMALEERDYQRAVQLLREAIALDPNDAALHVSLAAALAVNGQDELAAAERQIARDMTDRYARLTRVTSKVSEDPENADLRCEAGLILMEQGFWAEGADWIKTAIDIDPRHRPSHEGLAKYYEHAGDVKQAERHRKAAGRAGAATENGPSAEPAGAAER